MSKNEYDQAKSGALREKMNALPYDLIPFQEFTNAFARVAEHGAQKYAPWNWSKGLPRVQIIGSLLRHTFAYLRGEERDKDSGLLHTDHILWNATVLSHSVEHGIEDGRRGEPPREYNDLDPHHYTQITDGAPYRENDLSGQRVQVDLETMGGPTIHIMSADELAERIERPAGANAVLDDLQAQRDRDAALAAAFHDVFADLFEGGGCACCSDDDWDEEGEAALREMMRDAEDDEMISRVLNRVDGEMPDFTGVDEDDDLLTALSAMFACGREVKGEYNKVGDLVVMSFHITPDTVNVEGDVSVEFTDPEAFANFASGGFVEPTEGLMGEAGPEAVVPQSDDNIFSTAFAHIPPEGTPIKMLDLKAGQHVVLREDTGNYPMGTIFVVEHDSPANEKAYLRSYIEHDYAGTWDRIRFDVIESITVTDKERRGLVHPREMEVGRWYRVAQLHTGRLVDEDAAGIWKCRSVDDETAHGTKPGWDEGRRAIPLAASVLFEEVRPRASVTPTTAWEPVK